MKIKWLEWSKETFELAKKQNRPVLLDIHGVWCHWCHVQDENTYSNDIVIELIEKKFIPVKVDTDSRPDINERYNQGGWPTTAVLTPDGDIVAGATYMPAAEMAMFLERTAEQYRRGTRAAIEREDAPKKAKVVSVIDDMTHELASMFDAEYGGFGFQPKFPFPDAVELLFLQYRKSGDTNALKMALKTLDGLMGLFDQVEGGFYRYSVTREWNLPHYEKMMESNAQLIENYIHAAQITGDERYRKIAERTADYILNNLTGSDGFYSSQDAGQEEGYYGANAEERAKMEKPYIDKNVYANLNGLAISALLKLGGMYRRTAHKILDKLLASHFNGRLMKHHAAGKLSFLSDNVYFSRALMDAYEVTGNNSYIQKAKIIIDSTIENFFDHGFNDRMRHDDTTGLLKEANRNITYNAAAAGCLLRLAFYTDDESYREKAEETLAYFAQHAGHTRIYGAPYAIAAEILLDGIGITVKNITVAGDLPYDPRIMIRYDPTLEKILMCRGMKCTAFGSTKELEKNIR